MKKGLVSIITPVYNVEKYVRDSLESVFNQNYRNIEIIIVDDRGTDNSMKIVREVMANCPFTYSIITQERNCGVSEARNIGINQASGDYIFFLDSDDLITSDCIELLYNNIIKHDADMVISNYNFLYEKDFNTVLKKLINFNNNKNIDVSLVKYNEENDYVWNILYKKDLIINNEIYFEKDIRLAEDALWITLIQFKAKKMIRINAQTYFYRITSKSSCISLCANDKYVNNLILVIERLFIYLSSGEFSSKEKGVIISRIRSYKNGIYSSIVSDKVNKEDVNYEKLRKIKIKYNDLTGIQISTRKKNIERLLSIMPILENYYIYTGIFKIKSLLNRK